MWNRSSVSTLYICINCSVGITVRLCTLVRLSIIHLLSDTIYYPNEC